MEDFESILQQQQFEGGTATGVLDHEWVILLINHAYSGGIITQHTVLIINYIFDLSSIAKLVVHLNCLVSWQELSRTTCIPFGEMF